MRWYLQSLPPKRFIVVYAVLLLSIGVFTVLMWLMFGRSLSGTEYKRVLIPFPMTGVALCVLGSGLMAMCRVRRMPTFGSDYSEWLARAPWTASKRLPFGPWQPVLLDVIPLGIMGTIATSFACGMMLLVPLRTQTIQDASPLLFAVFLLPGIVFFLFWIGYCYVCVCRRWNWSIFAPVFCIGLLFQLARLSGALALTVAAVLLLFGIIAVWRRQKRLLGELQSEILAAEATASKREVSSTSRLLSPKQHKPWLTQIRDRYRPRAIAIGVLVYVWTDLGSHLFRLATFRSDADSESMHGLFQLLGIMIIGFISFLACVSPGSHQSHLSLIARWATGRWLVPAYDRVCLPFVLAVLLWAVVMMCGYAFGISNATTLPFTWATAAMLGIATGPNYEHWSLTAPISHHVKRTTQRRKS